MIEQDISLRHLRVLTVVLHERSLTRAAEILETSQPTISKIIARLRTYFDDPLFVRTGHRLEPTPRALALGEHVETMLSIAGALRLDQAPFDPAVSTREFRLMLTDVGMLHFLPALMERLSRDAPAVRVQALPMDYARWDRMLESGEADLAIGDFPLTSRRLRRQQFYAEGCRALVRLNHPRCAGLGTIEGFLAEEHVLVGRSTGGHAAHRIIESALEAYLPSDRVRLRVPSFLAAAAVVRRSEAIATMPANLAELAKRAFELSSFVPPLTIPEISIAQFWHERMHQDAPHRWFRALLHNIFRRKAEWNAAPEA